MLKIRAGEWDTQTRDELFPHQDRSVSEIIIHQDYYKGGLFNDVALLLLHEPVELSEIINTACLPPQDYNFDGSRCFASGWGKDVWGKEGKYQVILKKIDLPMGEFTLSLSLSLCRFIIFDLSFVASTSATMPREIASDSIRHTFQFACKFRMCG